MKIIVDDREPKEIVKEIIKNRIEVEVKHLVTADFIIQTKTLDGKIQNIGIERKIKNDFLNSIIDKRLLNQLSILKENFDVALLILEGEENLYKIRDFHPNSIRGMLATIAIDFNVPIIPTLNYRDTASFLAILEKRKPLTLKEQQEYLVESLPGIGPSISRLLLVHFKNIKNIVNASEEDLQKVDKIGKLKAKEIKKVIEENYSS